MLLLDTALAYALCLWFAHYLINHADLFARLRADAMPALPPWLRYPLECSFCWSFWCMAAMSLFTGWTPLLLMVPPICLGVDLCYRRLTGKGCE